VFASTRRYDWVTRRTWTIAVASLIAHYLCAFQFYHGWSHSAAYADTARQTAEVFSINWGGGVFINYALLVFWIVDLGWWWFAGLDAYRKRPRWIGTTWHALLLFIIFNATVVFENGVQRWVGLLVCLIVGLSWAVHFLFTEAGSMSASQR
jgi:hypothetical protein